MRINLTDNRLAWELRADGSYVQRRPGAEPEYDTHERLVERTRKQVQAARATRRRVAAEAAAEDGVTPAEPLASETDASDDPTETRDADDR